MHGFGLEVRARRGHSRALATISLLALLAACSPVATPTPSPVPSVAAGATPASTPSPTETAAAANPEDCPAPDEPITANRLERYGDERCFPAGVTVDGWWHRTPEGTIVIGQRVGSVDARMREMVDLTVSLRSYVTLPSESGYARFSSPTVTVDGDGMFGIADALVTPLANPATTCPGSAPLPVGVFLQSLAECYAPGVDVTIVGWRDIMEGLCGCGPFYIEKPKWLTSEGGVGWLFGDPSELDLDDFVTLYAPDEDALATQAFDRRT